MFGGLNSDNYDRQYSDRYLISRLASYFVPHKRALFSIIGLLVLFALIASSSPVIVSAGVQALEDKNGGNLLQLIILGLLVIGVFNYVIYRLRRRLTAQIIADVIGDLRKAAFNAAVERDLAFYDENKSGKIVSRITSDTQDLSQVIVICGDLFEQLMEFLIIFLFLITRDWQLTLLLLAMMPVVFVVTVIFRNIARTATRQGSRALAAVNDKVQESVTGISVAKNFRQEAMIYNEFTDTNNQSYTINLRRGFVLATIFPVLNALAGFVTGSLLYAGAIAVLNAAIDIGDWYLFILAVDRFWQPVINLSSYWSQIQLGLSALERIFALIDAENLLKQTADNHPPAQMRGEVDFNHVLFQYKTGERVLDDFNLKIKPGESLAFVGHTGAGKSTIAKALARFYEFQGGEIRVDGSDIRTFNVQEYRSHLGIVPQQPFLFSGTVMDNIRYARPNATDAEIREVANSIGGGEWLETLPDGLNSDVGERGARLSMGQRQLVSLLRVLVQRPAIFILDEATASIDPFTETQIQEALDLILSQSTSILIAHRLSTVRSADRIIALRDGKIIEQGSHEQLVEQGGYYAELYNTYFRHQSLNYIENSKEMFATGAD
ncbi:MAG TPA: ABC transporter ATP-binding protein [Phototrophicaceae bacterium]|nr:ABC transporter ATP-binding protein [Phototrophicaceae bacterium]